MTPRQADKLIKAGKPVDVLNKHTGEKFLFLILGRDRWNLYGTTYSAIGQCPGAVFDRGDIEARS